MIKEKLIDLFTENGIPFRENDRSFILRCPQCGKEDHLYVFKEKGYGKCQRCSESFGPVKLIMGLTGMSYDEAKSLWYEGGLVQANGNLEGLETEIVAATQDNPLNEFPLPYGFFRISTQEATPGREYMLTRGVKLDIMEKYDVRYCPVFERVMFPVYMNGKPVGYQGRDITGKAELRYNSPTGFSKGRVLLGYDLIDPKKDYVILSEGPVDALKLAILGNSVCSMGKGVSRTQIELIKDMKVSRVYLALDPDAFMETDKIMQAITPQKEVWLMQPPEGVKDFGDCDVNQILKCFLHAKRYSKNESVPTNILKG